MPSTKKILLLGLIEEYWSIMKEKVNPTNGKANLLTDFRNKWLLPLYSKFNISIYKPEKLNY